MDLGGNEAWKAFWEGRVGRGWGRPGEGGDVLAGKVVGERYSGGVGEEWKERLGCRVEGREFGGVVREERGGGGMVAAGVGKSEKEVKEEFFARKGGENGRRVEGVAPSLGGKYAGFGSEPVAAPRAEGGVDAFQADPMGALTKGFWGFAGAVGKGAKTLNEGYIQPTAQKVMFYFFYSICFYWDWWADIDARCSSRKQIWQPKHALRRRKRQRPFRLAPRARLRGSITLWRIRVKGGRVESREVRCSRRRRIFGIRLGMRVRIGGVLR